MADLETYQNFVDTRCNLCQRHVGIGIQCSLCHLWYHIAPEQKSKDPNDFGNSSSAHHGGRRAGSSDGGDGQSFSVQGNQSSMAVSPGSGLGGGGGGGGMTASGMGTRQSTATTQQSLAVPSQGNFGGPSSRASGESFSHLTSSMSGAAGTAAASGIDLSGAASMIFGQAAIGGTVGSGNAGGDGRAGPSALQLQCPGIEFPRYLPFFCSDCEVCCASADMHRITAIYEELLTEERDELSTGAPVIFGSISASFVRKRVRAIGNGPDVLSEQFSAERLFGAHSAHAALAQQQSISFSDGGNNNPAAAAAAAGGNRAGNGDRSLPPQLDFFDDGRFQRTQLKWESMFPRQTLSVLRQVLAHIYPHAYDDTAIINAAKAAKARHRGRQVADNNSSAAAAAANAAILEATQAQTNSLLQQMKQQRIRQAQDKFFAPISFVAADLAHAADEDDEDSPFYTGGGGRGAAGDDGGGNDISPSGVSGRGSRAGNKGNRDDAKKTAREQDIEMMEMQHQVTLSRLGWTPQEIAVSVQERDVFGPQPVYVNPVTSAIRLSEVVVEVGPDAPVND